jgi:hypothetical protein
MAAPVAASVTIPSDSGNTGKKIQTQSEVIGSDTVHAHFFIPRQKAKVLGVYRAASAALQSVQAAAQNGTSTAFLWAHVPTAVSGKKVRLRQLRIEFQNVGVTSMPTVPRIGVARFTFTGTASGATQAGAKLDASAPTPVLDQRTAVTGLTVTLDPSPGSLLSVTLVPAGLLAGTAASFAPHPSSVQWLMDGAAEEDEYLVLSPGEGVVLYQLDAGTASDSRRFAYSLVWDEIDTA